MEGRQFLYFLTNASDQFATFQNGFLEWSGNPMPLEFTPDGWQDISILTERNKKYFGLDRTYSAPQSFVNDGADILKSIFYNQGIEEVVYLLILEQQLFFDPVNYGYYYSTLCKCEVDLSTIIHEGEKVTASLLEGDITKYLKANESTQYEIPLDVPDAVNVLLDGLALFATAHYKNPPVTLPSTGSFSGTITITFLAKEGDQANILNQSSGSGTDVTPFVESVKGTQTIPLKGSLIWKVDQASNIMFNLHKVKAGVLTSIVHSWSMAVSSSGSGVVNVDETITLNEGEGLLFKFSLFATSPHANAFLNFEESDFTSSYTTRLDPTQSKALKPLYVLQQLVLKMTDGKFTADSTFLLNLVPYILFTSGDAIRQLSGSVIKTSLTDFFGFMRMAYGVGIGPVNGVLRMERMQYWCNTSNIIPLENASALKVSVATEFLFSNLKIGYPNKLDNTALGNINGRSEFCMTHYYTTPELRSQTTLDLTTQYNAGMYVIENTRLNSIGKTTSDGANDNDVFVLNVLPTVQGGGPVTIPFPFGSVTITLPPFYKLDREYNPYTTGLLDPASAFNVKLSPKWCIYNIGAYLRSCLTNLDSKSLLFASADKNVDVRVLLPNGTNIGERDNVAIAYLTAPFFKTYKFDITVEAPDTLLLANPLRSFSFEYNDSTIELFGFDMNTGTQPADDRQQIFTLLASADCDMTQLTQVSE